MAPARPATPAIWLPLVTARDEPSCVGCGTCRWYAEAPVCASCIPRSCDDEPAAAFCDDNVELTAPDFTFIGWAYSESTAERDDCAPLAYTAQHQQAN